MNNTVWLFYVYLYEFHIFLELYTYVVIELTNKIE